MSKMYVLVRQSLKNKIMTKSFVVSSAIIFAVIVFMSCLPLILTTYNQNKVIDVEVYSVEHPQLANEYTSLLNENAEVFQSTYQSVVGAYPPEELETSEFEAIIALDEMEIYSLETTTISNSDTNLLNMFYQEIYNAVLIAQYDVDPEYLNAKANAPSFEVTAADPTESVSENSNASGVHLIIMVFAFMLLMFASRVVSMEIAEEKTNRAMEIILSSVTSRTHMISKLISGTLYMFTQLLVMVAGGIVGSIISSNVSESILGVAPQRNISQIDNFGIYLIFVFILLVVTVITYEIIVATLTSSITSVEDVSKVQTPISMIIGIAFYYMLFATALPNLDSLSMILGLIPIFNLLIAPLLFITGVVGIGYMLLSSFIAIVFMVLMFIIVQKPYKQGLLNYSGASPFKVLRDSFKGK